LAGYKLGKNGGFLTVTGEYLDRRSTGRSDTDIRETNAIVRSRVGDPKVFQLSTYINSAMPLGDRAGEAFAFGGYQFRDSTSSAFARNPQREQRHRDLSQRLPAPDQRAFQGLR
jgi:iron complex outermembrane receptor protein